jgi:asparagine synthase (glutamine-hydrolysing)
MDVYGGRIGSGEQRAESSNGGEQASGQAGKQFVFCYPFSVFETRDYSALKVSESVGNSNLSFQAFSTNRGINRSSDKSGRCPFAEHGVTIAAHARLDNREELCQALDMAVEPRSILPDHLLMHSAYLKWGTDCVHHFRGDWSFAIWDGRSNELHLAVDYISSYALFYFASDDEFLFSNSMKTLRQMIPNPDELNDMYVLKRIMISRGEDPVAIIKNVRKVPPGTIISYKPGQKPASKRYWFPTHLKKIDVRNEQELLEEFHRLYHQAVQRRMLPGQKIAAHLSGGLDSGSVSWVAADLLKKEGKRLQGYTGTEYFDTSKVNKGRGNEAQYAKITAEAAGNIDQVSFSCPDASMLDSIKKTVEMTGTVAHGVGNIFWIHAISEYAREQKIDTLLVGQVGNASVTWAGVGWKQQLKNLKKSITEQYQFLRYGNTTVYRSPVHPASFLESKQKNLYNAEWLNSFILNDYAQKEYDTIDDHLPNWIHPNRIKLLNFRAASIGSFWETMSQEYGFYHWDPTADQDLVEFCLRLPESYFARNGGRNLVRRAFDGKIPDAVLYKKLKGRQSSDWMQRFALERDRWIDFFAGLPDDHPAHQYINVQEFVKLIEAYDPENNSDPGVKTTLLSGKLARVAGIVLVSG